MADYRNLEVWQKAMELTMMIYDAADTFPNHERYGLVSQMERAAVSIPSNIAEGYGRQSDGGRLTAQQLVAAGWRLSAVGSQLSTPQS